MAVVTEQDTGTTKITFAESAPTPKGTGTRWRARLIAGNVQGSSGYYSEAMLRSCAGVFAEGTHVFLDHPGETEQHDRPERSVRDLAGKLVSTAVYEGDGLYADIEVYPHFASVIEAMAGDIGMSIRGGGFQVPSEDPAIPGPIITELAHIESVDFVTVPGAGGRLISLLESARPMREAHGMSARDLSAALDTAVTDEYGGEGTWVYVCDYGDDWLIYDIDGDNVETPGRYRQTYTVDDAGTASLTGDPVEVNTRTTYVPVTPDAVTESTTTTKEAPVAEIDNGAPPAGGGSTNTPAPVDMTEAADRATARVGELETQLAEARENARLASDQSVQLAEANRLLRAANERITRLEGAETARFAVAEAFKTASLPAAALARVTAAVVGLNGNALPLTEGLVDRTKLKTAIDAEILKESEYVASISAGAGAGQVRGMGATKGADLTEAQASAALVDAYKALGLDDDAATTAAKGR